MRMQYIRRSARALAGLCSTICTSIGGKFMRIVRIVYDASKRALVCTRSRRSPVFSLHNVRSTCAQRIYLLCKCRLVIQRHTRFVCINMLVRCPVQSNPGCYSGERASVPYENESHDIHPSITCISHTKTHVRILQTLQPVNGHQSSSFFVYRATDISLVVRFDDPDAEQ